MPNHFLYKMASIQDGRNTAVIISGISRKYGRYRMHKYVICPKEYEKNVTKSSEVTLVMPI